MTGGAVMRKMKYEDAVMEIVKFDFEDVLEGSDDYFADGNEFGENENDESSTDNPWA